VVVGGGGGGAGAPPPPIHLLKLPYGSNATKEYKRFFSTNILFNGFLITKSPGIGYNPAWELSIFPVEVLCTKCTWM
jgi:hypothetical protein